jgi:Putative DNA-binding domain
VLTLRELQRSFLRALLNGEGAVISPLIEGDMSRAEERVAIHRNNIFMSLTRALKETFPAVCRLVDDRFFNYAANECIRAHPPERAPLAEYGAAFPRFLADFGPCRELIYLPDVARLEWLVNVAAHAPDATPLPPSALAAVPTAETPRIIFRLDDSVNSMSSRWPIDVIWRANRAGSNDRIELLPRTVHIEVRRYLNDIVFRILDAASNVFRQRLRQGFPLESATEAALAIDGSFNLAWALQDLFREKLVVGLELAPRPGAPRDAQ